MTREEYVIAAVKKMQTEIFTMEFLDMLAHELIRTLNEKKQTTRLLKLECSECGAIWRMSKQWADQVQGCPVCMAEVMQ